MTDSPSQEVTRPSYWHDVERRRKMGIIAAGVVLVLGIAGAFALSARGPEAGDAIGEATGTVTPAEETSATSATVPSYADTSTADVETSTAESGAIQSTPAPGAPRSPLVAYRKGGWLCVAGEDGAGERRIAESAGGVFTLSPDGTAIAFIESATGQLALAEVASGSVIDVGAASQDPPSWSPDSGWLAYTTPGPKVMRVTRFGTLASEVFAGSLPSVSVRDAVIVGLAPTGEVAVWRAGSISAVRASGTVTGLATDGATIYYGAMTASGSASLRAVGVDGEDDRVLVESPDSDRAVTFGDLALSPNAAQLVFAERSDDGFSRMFAVPARGGERTTLCVRRDCYPLRWAADGVAVLFIEGNAFQGDPTALMRVEPSGKSRRLLIEGAGR